jgi:hypothetical protein
MTQKTLTQIYSQVAGSIQQQAKEPFSEDLLLELMAIGVRSTVEQITYRILRSAETLLGNQNQVIVIDEQYTLNYHVSGKNRTVEFFNKSDLVASITQEPDTEWHIVGHIPKRVTLLKHEWPGWPYVYGSPEETYKHILQKMNVFEKAYRNALS